MESKTLTLLVLTLCICVQLSQQQQRIPRCLLSRMDFMPCQYRNPNLDRASPNNQYSIHYTRLKSSDSGSAECLVRPKNQKVREITTSGSVNTKIIYSPGFILDADYDNQLLGQYNIDCGTGRLAYFNVTTLDMQGDGDCSFEQKPRCQDYILIDRGTAGTTEICGNTTANDAVAELELGKFTVFFRSSEMLSFRGFEMYIICFRPDERDLPGCLTPMDFNSTCSAGSGCDNTLQPGYENGRKKRDAGYADGVMYDQYFPGYPSGLRMREDVANFHNQWRRQKRQADVEIRFIQRIVFFNESVNYTNSKIRIADTDGTETGLYEGVEVLQIFDATGEIVHYVGGVSSDLYPHFIGPGPLTIIDRYAFFQLFLIDPRGLIPSPEEEVELLQLNEPLLEAVPDSADFILNDTNPPFENLDFLLGRRRRSLTVTQQRTNNREFSDEALFVALRNREACNPALRTQAMSAIQLYMKMNETRVNEMQNFTMNCSLSGNELNCTVAKGCAPAMDKSNYCTNNNDTSTRKECDPFYGVVRFDTTITITTVTVEAINCNGQRATEVVFQTDD